MIRPVILCGGAGTRLWPVSREHSPKQFLKLAGENSLLLQTIQRVGGEGFARAIIVSAADQRSLVERELTLAEDQVEAVLLEPMPRNTAAAAALAAAWAQANGSDDLLLIMPSDHIIRDPEAFKEAIDIAAPHAMEGAIVTFGATASEPNTQYGYIEGVADGSGARRIAKFHEKPDAARAEQYVQSGNFYWNCGIFLVRASTLAHEMESFLPDTMGAVRRSLEHKITDQLFIMPAAEDFGRAENISIDHGIMEKTDRGMVIPVEMQWSDIGSWDAVWKLGDKDATGNVTHGEVTILDSRNSLVRSDGGQRIAAIGIENLAVISVGDAILIAPLDRVAEVKSVVTKMNETDRK